MYDKPQTYERIKEGSLLIWDLIQFYMEDELTSVLKKLQTRFKPLMCLNNPFMSYIERV